MADGRRSGWPQEEKTAEKISDLLKYSSLSPCPKFSEKNLRRTYAKQLADIISIIRHPAKGDELLTTEQRVNKAFMTVKSDRRFTDEQEKWLELIRRHLTQNLLMEREDIDYLPIFTREGASWGKLNKVFGDELEKVISEINSAIAA